MDSSLYQSLLQAVDGVVWEADAQTFEFKYVSDSVYRILGYTQEEWLSSPTFWQDHIYHEDVEAAIRYCHVETQHLRNHTFDYRMIKADGSLVWIKDIVSVVSEQDQPKSLCGIMVDITENKLSSELDLLENEVLQLTVGNVSNIEKVLNTYLTGLESLFPRMKCSILKVKDGKLYNWSSPSLENTYTELIEQMQIGPAAGSCGAAAYWREMVIANDIANDERWTDYKDIALSHGLKSCWSIPVIDSDDNVIAVLGIYYTTVKQPDETEAVIIRRVAAKLKLILENRNYAAMMQEMNDLLLQCQSLANFGNWQWDVESNKVTWSEVLYRIYGLNKDNFTATFEGYQALLHPEDKEQIVGIIETALQSGADTVFEERILRPDGEVRYLKSWTRAVMNEAGKPVKMIGVCLDITDAKNTQSKMEEIAWHQSHIIRAPLASLMGVVHLLKDEKGTSKELNTMLDHILEKADDLDAVIRKINNITG